MPRDLVFAFIAGTLLSAAALLFAARLMPARSSVRWLSKARRDSRALTVLAGTVLVCISGALLAALAMPNVDATLTTTFAPASDEPDVAQEQTTEEADKRNQAIANLRTYADGLRSKIAASETNSVNLPDVDTMISRLAARLENKKNDAEGWRMLGWSYLHTSHYADAVKAFETALTIEPANADIMNSLAEAKSQLSSNLESSSIAEATNPDSSADPQGPMVRGMVERLAARLETAPDDADGWMRLIRSRVVLGQTDQARDALRRALASFQNNKAKRDEISASARPLGIEAYPVN